MQTEQEKFMKAALKLAQKSAEEGEVPVGCVIVCDGKIVGRGRNRRETKKTALSHAEIEAIGKACKKLGGWRLHKCDLYVTLEPCPMCAGAIINARIRTVYYGADDSKAGSCGSLINLFDVAYNHKPEIVYSVCRSRKINRNNKRAFRCGKLFFSPLHQRAADNGGRQTDDSQDRKRQLAAELLVCLFLGLCRVDVQTLAQLHGAAVALGSGVFVQLVGLGGELVPVVRQTEIQADCAKQQKAD